MIDSSRIADVFVQVADTLVEEFDLVEFLHQLAAHGAAIAERPSVGIMLTDPQGVLHHLAASTHDVEVLEVLQLSREQGPCLDSIRTGRASSHHDLSLEAERWPVFVPEALALGFRSVQTFPMRLRERVIGALNIFGTETGGLDDEVARVVQALADVATIAILQERAVARSDLLATQLQHAFTSRTTIEQAKGALSRVLGIGVDEAFELLRREARSRRVRLTDLAHEILDDREAISRIQ